MQPASRWSCRGDGGIDIDTDEGDRDIDHHDDNDDANDLEVDRATPRGSAGAGTQCCTVGAGGRGPPRRAFRFRSPVPTLGRVRPDRTQRGGNANGDDDDDGAHHPVCLSEEGADDYLRLQEDDKMTPLL